MTALLPVIANTQQLKTPSEKDIVKTGGKSLFSLQLLHLYMGGQMTILSGLLTRLSSVP